MPEPALVFCSWSGSSADRHWHDRVLTALRPLERQGLISLWDEGLLSPGSHAAQERADAFARAALCLALLSPDSLASDACHAELQQARQRHDAGELVLLPVLLRSCSWELSPPVGALLPLPADGIPLAGRRDADEALRLLTDGVRQALENRSSLQAHRTPAGLPRLWNVPFPPSPFFTGRADELARLHARLQQRSVAAIGQALAISGLGGIGKTRLAVEYAYRYGSCYQAVLWVDAASPVALDTSYRQLAELLSLPVRHERELARIVPAVRRWLQEQRDYLLILDNLDEPALLFSPLQDWPASFGSPFLPVPLAGHLLLTSRAADLSALGLGLDHPVELQTLPPEEGALLLLRRAGRLAAEGAFEQADPAERQEALRLSEELGGLPLALDQAGAYLAATGESLAAYRQLFQQRQIELLRLRSGDQDPLRSDHPLPVAITWDLSFSRVRERHPAAADLLRFCAFLAPDAIPDSLLTEGLAMLEHPLAATAGDRRALNAAIAALRAYSLLSRDAQTGTLQVHRLAQVVLRASLSPEEQRAWQQVVIAALLAADPGEEIEDWPRYERLLPHALQCAVWIEAAPALQTPAAVALLLYAGGYLYERGRYQDGLPLFERARAIWERVLGPDHPHTATALNNLAALYQDQGRLDEALPLYERARAIQERVLGPDHPDTAASLTTLAALYQAQGRLDEALPLLERACAIWERVLGPGHPDTHTVRRNYEQLRRQLSSEAD